MLLPCNMLIWFNFTTTVSSSSISKRIYAPSPQLLLVLRDSLGCHGYHDADAAELRIVICEAIIAHIMHHLQVLECSLLILDSSALM